MMANNTTTTTLSQANCRKVFVQRDFSEGTGVRFGTRFPAELEGKIDKQLYDYTINTLNSLYEEAEKGSCSTYCEGGHFVGASLISCTVNSCRLYGLSDCLHHLFLCRNPLREVSEEGKQIHPRAERAGVDQAWTTDH